jgi:hypothetical protein
MVAERKNAEVRRILDRYLVEVVERYELCPWARPAREGGELGVALLWGTPTFEMWYRFSHGVLARPGVRVGMVIAPELAITPSAFRALRDEVAALQPAAGVADFHPDAALDLASPARLVPFLRRSPDPMLQLAPLELLAHARAAPPALDRAHQASALAGRGEPPRGDVADRIAAANHAMVTEHAAAIEQALATIAEDRRAAYARVGIRVGASR